MKLYITSLFTLITFIIYAQKKQPKQLADKVLLTRMLSDLEHTHGVRFSFRSSPLNQVLLPYPNAVLSLEESLAYIEKQTNMVFTKISAKYYAVKKNKGSCIILKDATDYHAIGRASITTDTGKVFYTNAKGVAYVATIKKRDSITLCAFGYRCLRLSTNVLSKTGCTSIIITPNNLALDEVVVRDYLLKGIHKTKDGSLKIYPKELVTLSANADPDVLSTLQLVPGVQSPLETASEIHIRGGTPDQNLVLWDGIRMYQTGHFFKMFSAFNPAITDKIDLYRNAASAKYGNAISSVVDIQNTDRLDSIFSAGFGLTMTHTDAYIKTPITKKASVLLSMRRSFTDVIKSTSFDRLSTRVFQNTKIVTDRNFFTKENANMHNRFYFVDYNAKLVVAPTKKDKVIFSGLYMRDKLDYKAALFDGSEVTKDQQLLTSAAGVLKWQRAWNTAFSTKASFSMLDYNLYGLDADIYSTDYYENILKKNHIKEHSLKLESTYDISPTFTFLTGYHLDFNQLSYNYTHNSNYKPYFSYINYHTNTTHALYAELNATTKKWYASLGFRQSYHRILRDDFLETRLNIGYQVFPSFRIKASVENRNQIISQIFEYFSTSFALTDRVWGISDDKNYPLLQSRQATLGGVFSKKGWNIDLEGYIRKTKGLTSLTGGFENTYVAFSKGDSDVLGLDLLIKKNIGDYTSWVGYSLSQNTYTFPSFSTTNSFAGNYDIRHVLKWAHTYTHKNLSFSFAYNFSTGAPYTRLLSIYEDPEQGLQYIYAKPNKERLPQYNRLDFSTAYTFALTKQVQAKLGISFFNLLDGKNLLGRSFRAKEVIQQDGTTTFTPEAIDKVSLGFTPNLSFRLYF